MGLGVDLFRIVLVMLHKIYQGQSKDVYWNLRYDILTVSFEELLKYLSASCIDNVYRGVKSPVFWLRLVYSFYIRLQLNLWSQAILPVLLASNENISKFIE